MDPIPDDKTPDIGAEPNEADDVEGHSMGGAYLGTVIAGSAGRQRTPDKKTSDESLTPLTKPFPSMRTERPK